MSYVSHMGFVLCRAGLTEIMILCTGADMLRYFGKEL